MRSSQAGTPTRPGPGGAPHPGERRAGERQAGRRPGGEGKARHRKAGRGTSSQRRISRRALIQVGLVGGAAVAAVPLISRLSRTSPASKPTPGYVTLSLNPNWLFGGQYTAGAEGTSFDDSGFAPVTLPHTVVPLSWRDWDAGAWQQIWIYRRHFSGRQLLGSHHPGPRIFADFDGVMTNATVAVNGHAVATHQGGYLPFSAELTGHVTAGRNLLAVVVDARGLPVPPFSPGNLADSVDYFQPGGIYRDVRLRTVPQAFLSDLFAQPANVLSAPRVDVQCTIDSALKTRTSGTLLVTLLDGQKQVAVQRAAVSLTSPGLTTVKLSLTGLKPVSLWSPASPKLYTVQATLAVRGAGSHVLRRQIGFREASFQPDGFYLNGERLQLFGLNRHQLYPYAGMAMPARVQRRDAEILKNDFNCNMVRCSHYPQSPAFLDACDELGLLVWEEAPGWHNVSTSAAWQDLVRQNVRDMVVRDRSRPSVIIWGTRLNETADLPGLWAATRQAAAELDGSRPSSGAMTSHDVTQWAEDVFAFNDYDHNAQTGVAELVPPISGLPYLVTETVGVLEALPKHFAWTDPPEVLLRQATLHARAQSLARSNPGYSGLLAWAGFDYCSPDGTGGAVKWPGVADGFRVPKPGSAIYQSQVDPAVRPVIVPVFFWELGGALPVPDPAAMVASNCQRLEVYIGGKHVTTALPAAGSAPYGHLPYPPFLVDLPAHPAGDVPELLIEGYADGRQVAELRMSSDPSGDSLAMTADDAAISADGTDATRVVFRAVDAYGNLRRYPAGEVTLTLTGPAALVGDNPFAFGEYGGLGAVWIRSLNGRPGPITLTASQPELGQAQVKVRSLPADPAGQLA